MNDLYWFNPDCEMAVADGGPNYTPPAAVAAMAADLAFLPAVLASDGDSVLVPGLPGPAFLDGFRRVFRRDARPVLRDGLAALRFRRVLPWGWSPAACRLLAPALAGGAPAWDDARRRLHSRLLAVDCLRLLRGRLGFPAPDAFPAVCRTLDEARRLAASADVVVKAPWSSSGRGVLMLRRGALTPKEEQIVGGVLRRQGFAVVERRQRRLLDFAMEFEARPGGRVDYLGLSVFATGPGGAYEGNRVAPQRRLRDGIAALLPRPSLLDETRGALLAVLPALLAGRYEGPLGVDMMVCEGPGGAPAVHPCVEVNLRHTMGLVALRLAPLIAPGSEGLFRLRHLAAPGALARAEEELRAASPLILSGGLVAAGHLPLTPVGPSTRFAAELSVRPAPR